MLILTPDEIRKEENSANENGLPYEEMMENAGMGCAKHIYNNYPDSKSIVIICGKGKNGGDGFVIARGLFQAGKNVSVICAFNSPSDKLSQNNREKIEGEVEIYDGSTVTKSIISVINNADIIVDAVFGIGFKGVLPENIKKLFFCANSSEAVRIAVDIPSGLSFGNSDTGDCFRADETLSMLCYKKEHIYKPFSDMCGKTTVIPIGFSVQSKGIQAKTKTEIRDMLPCRPYDSNKGTFGKALIIAGSYKMPGAGIIAVKGCLSSGAGLTYFAFPDRIYSTVTAHLTECVFHPLSSDRNGGFSTDAFEEIKNSLDNFSAIAIGPGLGTDEGAQNLVKEIIKNYKGRLIIDADGINIISRNIDILKESQADILLTPHPGEMSRLTGKSIAEINSDRINTALTFAETCGASVLLKGANTVIATADGQVFINPTGSSALSRGGSGDLLTGIAVSFAAQGLCSSDAGIPASYIHGLAGETAEKKYTAFSATTAKITDCISEALSIILSGK